jgi:DNA-binding transcriptional MerR regulator
MSPVSNHAEIMSISEMCSTYDVTPRALRFYEDKELLAPERRGTQRLYRHRERARLQLILRGKRFGFSLEDIRQLLDMYDREGTNQAQLARTLTLAHARLAQMQAQRAELDIAITELRTEIDLGSARLRTLEER